MIPAAWLNEVKLVVQDLCHDSTDKELGAKAYFCANNNTLPHWVYYFSLYPEIGIGWLKACNEVEHNGSIPLNELVYIEAKRYWWFDNIHFMDNPLVDESNIGRFFAYLVKAERKGARKDIGLTPQEALDNKDVQAL